MNRKALIIDDSLTMRQLESLYMKQLGFVVDEAPDGPSALAKLNSDHNIIISDLNMPGMNGLEMVSKIRAGSVNKNIPVVIISTENSAAFQDAAKKAGVSAWLQKPFTAQNLAAIINRILPLGDG